MGNQQCCQAGNKGQEKNQKIEYEDYNPQILPELSSEIKKVLAQKKPFQDQLKAEPQKVTKQYGKQYYEGPIDIANHPSGYGKMYKQDGSLVISHFKQGKSQGPSIFIFPEGSYYEGNLLNNRAEDQNGRYVSSKLNYEGRFSENAFDGKGKQKGADYQFQGEYIKGRRSKGVLKWTKDQKDYQYDGEFNQEFQYERQGALKDPVGTYKGSFVKGHKQGSGIYTYLNGMRYQGDYKNGLKHGVGTIYNFDNTIAYSGNFTNDLPNGEGFIVQKGKKVYAEFKDGIDVLTLPQDKKTQ